MIRQAGVVMLALAGLACADDRPPVAARPGEPIPGLTEVQRGRFLRGKALFDRLTIPEEGLGPLFNETRCSGCHDQPTSGGGGAALVTKATRFENGACDLLISRGGDNIQRRATDALLAAGMGPEVVPPEATGTVEVVGPPLYGLGLVDAIPESVLISLADPDDTDGDGISGMVGRDGEGRVGRFGRKGEVPTLAAFVETALRFELGLTTHLNPVEEAVNGVPVPIDVDPAPEPEIDERGVNLLTDYVRLLAAPERAWPQTHDGAARVRAGESLFGELGCSSCHIASLPTDAEVSAPLGGREVPLYSDLLLHDMGDAFADVCGPHARPSEYRTAPLWGLRLRDALLHDGRASTPEEAILEHGGEGAQAREAFAALTPEDRAILMAFLASL